MPNLNIRFLRQPTHWSNGVEKAEIRGDWTVVPRVGDRFSLTLYHCFGDVGTVVWKAPDHVIVVIIEPPTASNPEEDIDRGPQGEELSNG